MKNKEYYIRLGEAVERLEEKNCPTDPSKWSYYKSQAKKKFDVYPSAYANGWASKQYGDAGGGWKKCASEATDAQETEFHTQLDKLVHKTFGKSPEEEKMNEKFDKTHLGILQYAFKDIDRINPSEPAYKRLVDMLDKLSKQELQQIASVDIKFLSLLAKNLLSKKESVNEAGYTVKAKNPYQFLNGVVAVLGAYLRDEELGPKGKRELQNILKSLEYMRMYFYANMSESVNESHFQVGDKVKMSHGGVGVVKSLDKEDGGDDEKYYNIELPNGEVMKHAPNELTLAESVNEEIGAPVSKTKTVNAKLASGADMGARPAPALGMIGTVNIGGKKYQVKAFQGSTGPAYTLIGHNSFSKNTGMPIWKYFMNKLQELNGGKKVMFTPARDVKLNESVNESSMSDIDIIAQEAKDFKDFVKEFYNEYKDFPKDRDTIKWLKGVYDNRSTNEAELPNAVIPSSVKVKLTQAIDKIKDSNLTYNQKLQVIGKIIDGLGVDKKELAKISTRIKSTLESVVNEVQVADFKIGDFIHLTRLNKTGMVTKISGNKVTIRTPQRFITGDIKDVEVLYQDGVIPSVTEAGPGLWANMRAKRARGEAPARKGSKAYKSAVAAGNKINKAESVNEGNSSVEIGDIIFFPPANSAATVIDRFGRSVTLKLANGKKVKTVVDKVKLLAQDNVNEGNAFTGALFKARKEGLTEFEFNGKKYPVHKLEEEEKEETLAESKLTKNSLKQIIKEEYHNVKTFMEEKYGFTPELGKVYSNLAAKPFLKEEEEEVIEEYDVENYEDLKEFVQFMAEYKSDINEAEYQGRKVKLGKIMQGDVKKFKVYVKNDKGNVVKVNFGQGGDAKGGTMRIRKDNPEARASFRARHNCDTPGPRWKARYWSCRKW